MMYKSFREFLFRAWPTFAKEVADGVGTRLGKRSFIPYTEINDSAQRLLTERYPSPASWTHPDFRATVLAEVIGYYERLLTADAVPKSSEYTSNDGRPVMRTALDRIEALCPGIIDESPCCHAADPDDLAAELVERLI